MANRKKTLEKGVESLEREIKLHEEKLEQARKDGKIDLEKYYQKEIEGLRKTKERKEMMLEK
jgi:hypothetical protein